MDYSKLVSIFLILFLITSFLALGMILTNNKNIYILIPMVMFYGAANYCMYKESKYK